jgi:hypothetical protein
MGKRCMGRSFPAGNCSIGMMVAPPAGTLVTITLTDFFALLG